MNSGKLMKLGHGNSNALFFPEREFTGKITYIFPQVDNTTRTLKVRIELANKGFELKADMFADVVLQINYGNKLVVPQEAVMDSDRNSWCTSRLMTAISSRAKSKSAPKSTINT